MYSLGCKLKITGWIKNLWLVKNIHFLWLKALTRPVNNPMAILLIKPNIILYHFNN